MTSCQSFFLGFQDRVATGNCSTVGGLEQTLDRSGKDENEGNKYDGYFSDLNGYRDIFTEKKTTGK